MQYLIFQLTAIKFYLFFLFIFLFILRLDCESYYAELCLQVQNSFNTFI